MQVKMILPLIGFLFANANSASATSILDNAKLREAFPYAVLNDDHGILAKHDLQTNACDARPTPFPPPLDLNAFEYWQCYETKNISTECDPNWTDILNAKLGLVTIDATLSGFRHEYLTNHPWPLNECKQFDRRIKRLLKKARYACISGNFYHEVNESGRRYGMWTFDRIKTKSGCEGTSNCNPMTKKDLRTMCPDLKF